MTPIFSPLFAVVFSLTGQGYVEHFLSAWEAFRVGELAEARTLYENCLNFAPESPVLALHLACLAAREGNLEEGKLWLERAFTYGFEDRAYLEWEEDLAQLRQTLHIPTQPDLGQVEHNFAAHGKIQVSSEYGQGVQSPDGLRGVRAGVLWDLESGEAIAQLASSGRDEGTRFHPAGQEIAVCSAGRVSLWNARDGSRIAEFEPRLGEYANSLEFSADGRILLAAGRYTRGIWDCTERRWIPLRNFFPSAQVHVVPAGDRLVFIDRWYAAIVDIASGRVELNVKEVGEGEYLCRFREDGQRLALHDANGNAWLIDLVSHQILQRVRASGRNGVRHSAWDRSTGDWITIHLDGHRERWSEHGQGNRVLLKTETVELTHWQNHALVSKEECARRNSRQARKIGRVGWLPGDGRAFARSWDGDHLLFESSTGECSAYPGVWQTKEEPARFSSAGDWKLERNEQHWRVLRLSDESTLHEFDAPWVRIQPRDEHLLVGTPNGAQLQNARSGEVLLALPGFVGEHVAWSPDGQRLAAIEDERTVVLYELDLAGRPAQRLVQPERVLDLSFDGPGKRLAVALYDGLHLLLDTMDGRELLRFDIGLLFPELEDSRMKFVGQDHYLLTGRSGAHPLELWDLNTGMKKWSIEAEWPNAICADERLYTPEAVITLHSGTILHDLSGRDLDSLQPDPHEHYVVALAGGAVAVLAASDMRELYRHVVFADSATLSYTPKNIFAGKAEAIRLAEFQRENSIDTLAGVAAWLCDPRRLRAAAAGVALTSPRLPAGPTLEAPAPAERRRVSREESELLSLSARDAGGIQGFEICMDSALQLVPRGDPRMELEQEGRLAHLRLSIPRAKEGEMTQLALRAVGRSGLLSQPWRITIEWR